MRTPAIILIGILTFTASAFAQNNAGEEENTPNKSQSDQETRNGYWEANLAGGNYLVALGRISSVSRHKYLLDGTIIVDEVTVDTAGQALARFYFITPASGEVQGNAAAQLTDKAIGILDKAANSAGSNLQDMVQKKYPLTTHSKTIEYRVFSEQQLSALYGSVKTAWVTGKGRVFTQR